MKGHARNLMTERVTSVAPDDPLETIAATLVGEAISGVPVVDASESVVGMVTESDIIIALLRQDAPETPARTLMSAPAITIDEFAPTDEVIAVLRERRIHHLPVVRAGKLVGIIAPSDVLRYFVQRDLEPPPEAG